MELLIVSGLSGAGKSKANNILEDIDYYCVDNLPVELIPEFAQHCLAAKGQYERVSLVTDIRGNTTAAGFLHVLDKLDAMGCSYSVLFFEASNETLLKRYKESRRPHPLQKNADITIMEAIERERELMEPIRNRAAYIFDTSFFSIGRLQQELVRLFSGKKREKCMTVEILSFGFKHGNPEEADLMFDVRFLPNPYYIDSLRNLTGLDKPVSDFVFSFQQTIDYFQKITELVGFALPLHLEEGRTNLVIAVGCTGGRHRSVAVAEKLAKFVQAKGFATVVRHRDI